MAVKLVRIDSRLIHGQITINWVKALDVEKVIVLSNSISKDSLQYKMMQTVTPHWLDLAIVDYDKMQKLLQDSRFQQLKTMIIVATVADACFLIQNGLKLASINIGSLKFEPGKKMVTDTIAVDEDDARLFEWLNDQGVKLEARKVFQDKPKNFWKVLKDKKFVLAE